jgi:hypothetical protein
MKLFSFITILTILFTMSNSEFQLKILEEKEISKLRGKVFNFLKIKESETQIQMTKNNPNLPHQNKICLEKVHSNLKEICKTTSTTHKEKQKLAFHYFICLKESAGVVPICPLETEDMVTCLNQLCPADLQTYNNYLLHVDNVCYLFSNEMYNELFSKNVNQLVETSQHAMKSISNVFMNIDIVKEKK